MPNNDYDLEGFIKKYGKPDQSKGQHLADEFKRPNHITFSDESMYSTPTTPGGKWEKKGYQWEFTPSEFNKRQHTSDELRDYFNQDDKGAILNLPTDTRGISNRADRDNARRIMDSLRQHGNSIVESIPWPTLPSARKDPERIEATKIGIDAAGAIGFTSPLAMQDKLYQIVKDMAVDPYIRLGAKNLIDEIERKGVSENTIDRIVDIKGIYGHHGGGEFLPIPPQRKSGGVELTEGMRNWAQLSRNQQLYTDEGRKTVGSLDVPSYVVYDPKYKYSDKANLIPHEVGHGEAAYNSKMPEADLLERIYSQYNPGSVYASMATASKGGSQGDFLRNVGGLHYAKPSEQLAQLFANRVSGGKMYLEDIHVPEDARVTTDLAKKMWARPPGDYTFMDALNEYKQLRTTRPVDAYIQPSPSGIPILDDWYKYLYERKK